MVGTDHDETDLSRIEDLARYPGAALHGPHRLDCRPRSLLALTFLLLGGLPAPGLGLLRVDGAAVARHVHASTRCRTCSASRRYATSDDSRNNWVLAILTMGEGWHNNHHHYHELGAPGLLLVGDRPHLLRDQGCSSLVGLVWDLRQPPRHVIDGMVAESTSVTASEAAIVPAMGAAPPAPASPA